MQDSWWKLFNLKYQLQLIALKRKLNPPLQHYVSILHKSTLTLNYWTNKKQVSALYCEKPTDPLDRFAEKFGSLFIKIKKKGQQNEDRWSKEKRRAEKLRRRAEKLRRRRRRSLKDANKKQIESSTASQTKPLR